MKISEKLLDAMAVGLVLGLSQVSCEKEAINLHNEACVENCQIDHSRGNTENVVDSWSNCPACGMG